MRAAGIPEMETHVAKYPALLAEWSKTRLVTHFPPSIPAQASHVRVAAFPGFLQGGGFLQIRYQLPPAEVTALFAEAARKAKAFYDGGDLFSLVNDHLDPHPGGDNSGLAGTSFHTSGSNNEKFPADYRIFVFAAEDHGGMWNHGTSKGMVVSTKRHEVIYFAESW